MSCNNVEFKTAARILSYGCLKCRLNSYFFGKNSCDHYIYHLDAFSTVTRSLQGYREYTIYSQLVRHMIPNNLFPVNERWIFWLIGNNSVS